MSAARIPRVLLMGALLGAGCSQQDFYRPITAPVSDWVDSGKPYVSTNRTADAQSRAERLSKALAAWQQDRAPDTDDYTIGAGDVMDIGVLDFEEPGRTSKILRPVTREGDLDFPWIGNVPAAGLKIPEFKASLVTVLAARFLKNPQVTVAVGTPGSKPIVITGAVAKPGIYYLNRNSKSLLEILAMADGLGSEAGDELNIIHGDSGDAKDPAGEAASAATNAETLVTIDLRKLIDEGDMRQNVWVRKNDIVTVPVRARDAFYVLGYVGRPGGYDLRRDKPVGAVQAVAMAGGLTGIARAENSFLIRETAKGQMVIPLDLTKIAAGVRPTVNMEPGDTLVIGSSAMARLSEFVRPGVSAGMSYTPLP